MVDGEPPGCCVWKVLQGLDDYPLSRIQEARQRQTLVPLRSYCTLSMQYAVKPPFPPHGKHTH
jgi:hypothetical protein